MADNNKTTTILLDTLKQMIEDVNEISGTNEKIERLRKYPQLQSFLKLLYDPLQTTGLTSTQLRKYKPNEKKRKTEMIQITDLINLLEKLYKREITGNEAKDQIMGFIKLFPDHEGLIYKIVDKDLETRLDVKQFNRAFPGLITEFAVALAKDFESGQTYFKKNMKLGWFISRKYDGIRCIVKVTNGLAVAYSRNGLRLSALSPLEELISKNARNLSFVLDGEVCSVDAYDKENFKEAVSQAKRKSTRMDNFRYFVFDMLTLNEFETCGDSEEKECRKFSKRQIELERFVRDVNDEEHIKTVLQIPYSEESFMEQQLESTKCLWEGLILRLDTLYKGKRSNDILKVKNFHTNEYVVQGYDIGSMRIISEKTGLEKTVDILKSVHIIHKGSIVNVGSGFNLEERELFFKQPELIVGKTISVKYFEESTDQFGKPSLRFPVFTALHGNERNL